MMIFSAGVLAALLACAGMAAGATWVADDDGGVGVDYTMLAGPVDIGLVHSYTLLFRLVCAQV